jgi:glycosyltransferase involved in cell wall biosynthesis
MIRSLRMIVDGRPLVGRRTGIGVHTAEIAGRLELDPPPLIATHAPIDDRSGIEHCRFRVDPLRLGVVWQQTRLRGVAREDKAELLWGPHGTLPLGLKIPSVSTIHDLTSLTMPLKHRMKTLASFNLLIARSIHAASHLACVSKATADEVLRGFVVEASRITIVPNGVDPFFAPGDDRELPFGLEHGDYILYV